MRLPSRTGFSENDRTLGFLSSGKKACDPVIDCGPGIRAKEVTGAISGSNIPGGKAVTKDIAGGNGVGRNQPFDKRDARFFLIVAHMLAWERHVLDPD